VRPGESRGIFAKPYVGFERGDQASTPLLVDSEDFDNDVMSYF